MSSMDHPDRPSGRAGPDDRSSIDPLDHADEGLRDPSRDPSLDPVVRGSQRRRPEHGEPFEGAGTPRIEHAELQVPERMRPEPSALVDPIDQPPRDTVVLSPNDAAADLVAPDLGELEFIGTATVLLRLGPFTVLTDPNFLHQGEHAKLGYGLRSRRLTEPSRSVDQLPPIDLVVLSHHHGDHFDQRAADGLRKDVPIVTNAHAARKLERQGFVAVRPVDSWQCVDVVRERWRLRVTSLPAKHAPQPLRMLLPPVMGSMLDLFEGEQIRPVHRTYVSGDTLMHDDLSAVPQRFPGVDLAIVHLGGTRVVGVMVTMDGEQGVELLRLIEPHIAVPVHYDDYTVFKSPLDEFRRAVDRSNLAVHVHYVDRGERYRFSIGGLQGR